MELKQLLNNRLSQLRSKQTMIESVMENPKQFIGKYKKEDLLLVKSNILETQAALTGIESWESKNKKQACQV